MPSASRSFLGQMEALILSLFSSNAMGRVHLTYHKPNWRLFGKLASFSTLMGALLRPCVVLNAQLVGMPTALSTGWESCPRSSAPIPGSEQTRLAVFAQLVV